MAWGLLHLDGPCVPGAVLHGVVCVRDRSSPRYLGSPHTRSVLYTIVNACQVPYQPLLRATSIASRRSRSAYSTVVLAEVCPSSVRAASSPNVPATSVALLWRS